MHNVKVRYPNGQITWQVVDDAEQAVELVCQWLLHLEQTHISPNSIKAYARHIARLGSFLATLDKDFHDISMADFDAFLKWRPWVAHENNKPQHLSIALRNQIVLAVKSFYRYMSGQSQFMLDGKTKHQAFDSPARYKPFLEHINQRRAIRSKEAYLGGDPNKIQKRVLDKRLTPETVFSLIEASLLLRDTFLITLLYNTGMRIGEALGLRHTDLDLQNKVIWVVPRADNENSARAKSGRTRGIPVQDYLMNMYEDYVTSEEYTPAFESGTAYVFCNVKQGKIGHALSLSYAQKLRYSLIKRTGIVFHWHMFRHTHASEAIAQGYNLLEVAERLGHASPQTTADFYRHLFSSELRKLYLDNAAAVNKRIEQWNEARLLKQDLRWL